MSADNKVSVVALRQQREKIIQLLTDHFANDTLEIDEYEHRMDQAYQATTLEALEALVQDLGPASSTALATAPRAPALAVSRPASKRIVNIMGGVERKGQWVVPAKLRVYSMMGGSRLDFREAVLPPGVTEIEIWSLGGGAEIIVPPHVAVEAEGVAILGGFEEMHRAPLTPDPERPLLRISGICVLGGVRIETRLPGESRKQARKRALLGDGQERTLESGPHKLDKARYKLAKKAQRKLEKAQRKLFRGWDD